MGTDASLITRRELAELRAVHYNTVIDWERDGMPVAKKGSRGRPSMYSQAAVEAWLEAREAAAANGSRLDVSQERARKERAQALLAEQMYASRARDLLSRTDVEHEWAAEIAGVRAVFLAVPTTFAARVFRAGTLDGEAGTERVLREVVNEVLRELADPDREAKPKSRHSRKK